MLLTVTLPVGDLQRVGPLVLDSGVEFEAIIQALPNGAELGQRAEEGSLEFVDVMVEDVGVLDKSVVLAVDCQLDLAKHVAVPNIDKDIVGAFVEAIDHSHKFQPFLGIAVPQYFLVDADDLLLS